MKIHTIIAVVCFLALSSNCYADSWTGGDKKLHAVGGFFAGGFGYMVTDINKPEWRERDKVLVGWGAATVAAVAKETYDLIDYGRFSAKDAIVTSTSGLVGALTGTSIVYIDNTVFVGQTWSW